MARFSGSGFRASDSFRLCLRHQINEVLPMILNNTRDNLSGFEASQVEQAFSARFAMLFAAYRRSFLIWKEQPTQDGLDAMLFWAMRITACSDALISMGFNNDN